MTRPLPALVFESSPLLLLVVSFRLLLEVRVSAFMVSTSNRSGFGDLLCLDWSTSKALNRVLEAEDGVTSSRGSSFSPPVVFVRNRRIVFLRGMSGSAEREKLTNYEEGEKACLLY